MTTSPSLYEWSPDARRYEAHRYGSDFPAPPVAMLWHVSGDDPEESSALLVAQRCNRTARQPHFIWAPAQGELIQMTPLTHQCRLHGPESPAAGLVGVLVVTDADLALKPDQSPSQTPVAAIAADLSIPTVWPAGPPRVGGPRVLPTTPGHYCTEQVQGAR